MTEVLVFIAANDNGQFDDVEGSSDDDNVM